MNRPTTHSWNRRLRGFALLAMLTLALAATGVPGAGALAQTGQREVAEEPLTGGTVPGDVQGSVSDSEFWRAVRRGESGSVSIPDEQAAVLVQSEGDNWRAWRNGPVTVAGGWLLLGMLGLLALFFAVRGRIRIEAGPSGRSIERFNGVERFAHWLTAVSFVVLALTGLNLLYGKHVLLPAFGPEVFSLITTAGKYAHNYVAFAFMLGLVLMFVLWVRHNLPNRYDMEWIAEGGGLFTKGAHPPARKFNAGQKIIFWIVILGGLSLSISGVALLFPFEFAFFQGTFDALNAIGFNLPGQITAMEEMQLNQVWHALLGLFMMAVILAHIYIGTLGMEGAFDAMGTGQVDENWAREHHSVWVAEEMGKASPESGAAQPAE